MEVWTQHFQLPFQLICTAKQAISTELQPYTGLMKDLMESHGRLSQRTQVVCPTHCPDPPSHSLFCLRNIHSSLRAWDWSGHEHIACSSKGKVMKAVIKIIIPAKCVTIPFLSFPTKSYMDTFFLELKKMHRFTEYPE